LAVRREPPGITLFVAIFGAVLGPLFRIIIADYYLVKRQTVMLDDPTRCRPQTLAFRQRLDHRAVVALMMSGVLSIGLALLGAYGLIINVGDWGWLIGAVGRYIYRLIRSIGGHRRDKAGGIVKGENHDVYNDRRYCSARHQRCWPSHSSPRRRRPREHRV
jgi:cytosine/uracil/thiamine/allantoin permease